jgi:CubicO group peptidase (beta-lactamase class C family)
VTIQATSTIDQVLQDAIAAGDVPNVVAIAADDKGIIYEGAAGPRAVGRDDPVGADNPLRVASMTKPVCTVAALQLVERGNLDLDAPVERYCPEFADLKVLEGFDGATPKLRPPASRAIIRHLLTHTSGQPYWFWNVDSAHWHKVTGVPIMTTGEAISLTEPLMSDPGTTFQYGLAVDWLGKVVEAVSGMSLDRYFAENITGPLGMRDTAFVLTDEQRARSAPVHRRGENGKWTVTDYDWNPRPAWWSGGIALYSTPRDYLTFQRMLLGGGMLDKTKILERSSVDAMFTNQLGLMDFPPLIKTADLMISDDFMLGPGYKWGFGLLLNTLQQPGLRAAGSGGWAGICNTYFWVDPASRITGAIYSQFLPFVTPEMLRLYQNFEKALYASL